MSRPPSRKRKWNQLSQFRGTSTKVIPTEKQSVLGTNKCICSSSHMLCYGCMQLCVIHNSFASYGGMSFLLVMSTKLNVSEPEHWITWSHRTDVNYQYLRKKRIQVCFCLNSKYSIHIFLQCIKTLKQTYMLNLTSDKTSEILLHL